MAFFVQYDEAGNIKATITGTVAPDHPLQLQFEEPVETENKMVDLGTLQLIDKP